jgi:glycosyltransferase involved in cell wall biosynthesis
VRELVAALAQDWQRHPGGAPPLRLFAADARRADLPPPPEGCAWRPSRLSERTHARLWHRLRLPVPVECWTGPLDLFHATDFTLPPTLRRARTVLTIHDLAFERHPEETMPGMLGFLRSVVPRSARRADAIIAVSEATRRDLIDCYRLPPDRIAVIPHGVSTRFSPVPADGEPGISALREKYRLPDDGFILTVGTLQPRKNHLRLVQALAAMKHAASLVIAGGSGWAYEAVRAEVSRLGLEQRVILAGFADDADLPVLYRAAAVFAYPALYEGFGLPVLEAMACGLPVVASNTSSLPEVAGDATLLVDPLDPAAIADALDRALGDSGLRADLAQRGLARAAEFTWVRAARRTWDL